MLPVAFSIKEPSFRYLNPREGTETPIFVLFPLFVIVQIP